MPDISDELTSTKSTLVHPGMFRRAFIYDRSGWESGQTVVIRQDAGHGEHITLPWFTFLKHPDFPDTPVLRKGFVMTVNRFVFRPIQDPVEGGPLGTWGMSWYFVNTGEDHGPLRIEVGFVTEQRHEGH